MKTFSTNSTLKYQSHMSFNMQLLFRFLNRWKKKYLISGEIYTGLYGIECKSDYNTAAMVSSMTASRPATVIGFPK